MFNVISAIIDHIYDNTFGGDQTYIYYICAIMIPLCTILVWDGICSIFRSFTRWK